MLYNYNRGGKMKKLVCEFMGTMMLTLLACGVAAIGVNYVCVSLAFGLVIVAMIYTFGSISGCHINPAVSVAMTIVGRIKKQECWKYIIAQILGAITGSALLGIIIGSFSSLGANSYDNITATVWSALLIEIILTFVFVLLVIQVTDKKEQSPASGIVIGLTLTLVHLFGLPYTGTSVNPARSIAPALLQGGTALSQLWVFIVAPLIGGILAALFYKHVIKAKFK